MIDKPLFRTSDGRFLDLSNVIEFPKLKTKDKEQCEMYAKLGDGSYMVRMIKNAGLFMYVPESDYKKIYKLLEKKFPKN